MKLIASLPNTPSQLPEKLRFSSFFTQVDASLVVAKQQISEIPKLDMIVASFDTPLNWWLAAQMIFPDVDKIVYQNDGSWIKVDVNNSEVIFEGNSESATALKIKSDKKVENDLTWLTYRNFIFSDPEAEAKFQKNLRIAESLCLEHPTLAGRVIKHAEDGRSAAKLIVKVKQKIDRGESFEELGYWIVENTRDLPSQVKNSLRKEVEKTFKYRAKKADLDRENKGFRVELPALKVVNGVHPQSLRHLMPCNKWDVYIDETGNDFTEQAQLLGESDKRLGRVVALALPGNHSLAKLGEETHGVDLDYSEIQELLRSLMNSNIGILGANLKADIRSHSWIASIMKLVRWVLMMLPMKGETQVVFKIERRGDYTESATLKVLEETLTDELRQLVPERYDSLQLSLELVDKTAPYNGYVDVIANCWGSADTTKRKLLARTKWLGHCLLQSTDIAETDRLYQRSSAEIDAESWFKICTYVANEPGHSLLIDLLEDLGERSRRNPSLWRRYLNESQHRIALKDFDAGSLERALAWLSKFKPTTAELPALVKLQLSSAQLAASNHLGQFDASQLGEVMSLARRLEEEAASDACEACLRIATSATNCFDFASVVQYLEYWLEKPIAMPGRLNHGKLLSTMGQLCAFRGESEQALSFFDRALQQFELLSDPVQSEKNRRQTAVYESIVLMDSNGVEAAGKVLKAVDQTTGVTGTASIRKLARSAGVFRFEHYLLLRLLVSDSSREKARNDYLTSSEDWQMGEGHPWMLINAYRSWLLVESDRKDEALGYLQKAVDDCSENEDSEILHWMAYCLFTLGESIGLLLVPPLHECPSKLFPSNRLSELREAASNADRIGALNILLPFNFH